MMIIPQLQYQLMIYLIVVVTDSKGAVVVLLLQAGRVLGHGILHPAKEKQPGVIPACVPPCHNVPHLVDRSEMGGRGTV